MDSIRNETRPADVLLGKSQNCAFISLAICQAMTLLSAVAVLDSRGESSFKKSSKLDPIFFFDISFPFQYFEPILSQCKILFWSSLLFLDEAVKNHYVLSINAEKYYGNSVLKFDSNFPDVAITAFLEAYLVASQIGQFLCLRPKLFGLGVRAT